MSQQELIHPPTQAARHRELCALFATGLFATCTALWHIRQEKTYESDGFASYKDFLKSLQMTVNSGRLYANSGAILEELRATGEDKLITSVDTLKPIALLLSPTKQDAEKQKWIIRRQAEIVRLAAKVAHKGQEPLTEAVVARVAEKNFGIKPRSQYKKSKRKEPEALAWEHPFRKNARDVVKYCELQLAGLSADNAVHVARVHMLPGFMDLAQWFVDVVQESERASREMFEREVSM